MLCQTGGIRSTRRLKSLFSTVHDPTSALINTSWQRCRAKCFAFLFEMIFSLLTRQLWQEDADVVTRFTGSISSNSSTSATHDFNSPMQRIVQSESRALHSRYFIARSKRSVKLILRILSSAFKKLILKTFLGLLVEFLVLDEVFLCSLGSNSKHTGRYAKTYLFDILLRFRRVSGNLRNVILRKLEH